MLEIKCTNTVLNGIIHEQNTYFPSRGIARDVEGIISDMRRKNIVCERSIDIHKAIFSPESAKI